MPKPSHHRGWLVCAELGSKLTPDRRVGDRPDDGGEAEGGHEGERGGKAQHTAHLDLRSRSHDKTIPRIRVMPR